MQNLLTASQISEVDAYTIDQRNFTSLDLMESAAEAFVNVFVKKFPDKKINIIIFCGSGNNGGDGLAIARILSERRYKCLSVVLANFANKESDNYLKNLKRLKKTSVTLHPIAEFHELGEISCDVAIDAILGSGINKPLRSNYLALAALINSLNTYVVAVDVPTGFSSEDEIPADYHGVKADLVICFQRPKINFFFPESVKAFADFKVVDIGLNEDFIQAQPSVWKLTTKVDMVEIVKPRTKFSHKGTYGHLLLVAGSPSTLGAALLSAKASVASGSGLTTVCLPQSGFNALNIRCPEAMTLLRNEDLHAESFAKFNVIAIGPGLGLTEESEILFEKIIAVKKPLVIDADGLTLLSRNDHLLSHLPAGTILTLHLKEFDRLFGEHKSWWQRVQTARVQAQKLGVIIVLKNQYTFVCLADGNVLINPTGNPAMANGGMGDVLTGIIASLLAQSYSPQEAAVLGVYLHGKAGDVLGKKSAVVNAAQVAGQFPKTMKKLIMKKER